MRSHGRGLSLPHGYGRQEGLRSPSVTPAEPAIEPAVHVVTLVDLAGTERAWDSLFQHDLVLSAQRFQDGIEAGARPLEDLTQASDGHTLGAVSEPAHGGLELLPQDG
jgi:hypothetical protein